MRHRLLEAFLRRVAASPDAEAFALRGGMLVRTWDARRHARDADLVCSLPYRPRDMRARLAALLAARVADGVVFDERFRVDSVWPRSAHPGLTLRAAGEIDGVRGEMSVDLTFGLAVWPHARRSEVTTERGNVWLWLCPHEMVVATKLGVIGELGVREWRPKDLGDIWRATRRFARTPALGEALARHDLRAVLGNAWWNGERAAFRWGRYAVRDPSLPQRLDAVLGEVRDTLSRSS